MTHPRINLQTIVSGLLILNGAFWTAIRIVDFIGNIDTMFSPPAWTSHPVFILGSIAIGIAWLFFATRPPKNDTPKLYLPDGSVSTPSSGNRRRAVLVPALWFIVAGFVLAPVVLFGFYLRQRPSTLIGKQTQQLTPDSSPQATPITPSPPIVPSGAHFTIVMDMINVYEEKNKKLPYPTSILFEVRVSNTGQPSTAQEWTARVFLPDGKQVEAVPITMNKAVLRGARPRDNKRFSSAEALFAKTYTQPIQTGATVWGVLPFNLKDVTKADLLQPDTIFELSTKDVWGNEHLARKKFSEFKDGYIFGPPRSSGK